MDTSLEALLRTAFQEILQILVPPGIPCQRLDLEGKVDIDQKAIVEESQVHAVVVVLVAEAVFDMKGAWTGFESIVSLRLQIKRS